MTEPDDADIRFSLLELGPMTFTVTDDSPEAQVTPRSPANELEILRARVAELELLVPTVRPAHHGEETHTRTRCGFHTQVVVSTTTPRVSCAVCHEDLEPLEVLREMARKERNFMHARRDLHDQHKALQREIDELKKLRNNLQAQIKRRRS